MPGKLPSAVYLPTRRLHAVYAAGGPEDGSLYHFYTLCNRLIENPDDWHEVADPLGRSGLLFPEGKPIRAVHHCKQCQRIIDRDSLLVKSVSQT